MWQLLFEQKEPRLMLVRPRYNRPFLLCLLLSSKHAARRWPGIGWQTLLELSLWLHYLAEILGLTAMQWNPWK